jgi:hypothetical protein
VIIDPSSTASMLVVRPIPTGQAGESENRLCGNSIAVGSVRD